MIPRINYLVKMQNFKFLILLLVITFFAISCSKEENLPGLTGNITGYTKLYGEFGLNTEYLNRGGVHIIADNGNESFSATTNRNGFFKLKDLPTGNYVLTYSKDSFGTVIQYNVKHIGGKNTAINGSSTVQLVDPRFTSVETRDRDVVLTKLPTLTVDTFKITGYDIGLRFRLVFKIENYPEWDFNSKKEQGFTVFFSTDSTVSKENYEFSYDFIFELSSWAKSNDFYLDPWFFSGYGKGTRIFMKAYPNSGVFFNLSAIHYYEEPTTGLIIFPSLGKESPTINFVVN